MRRPWHAAALLAVLVMLGIGWFLATHEQVDGQERIGPSPAARANPYLAAMRFAERIGMTATLVHGADRLESLPQRATILLPAGRGGLSASRARTLDRWIQKGGHVMVEPEAADDVDPVLDFYGIKRDERARAPSAAKMEIELPGSDEDLTVAFAPAPVLNPTRNSPDLALRDDSGIWLASFPVGAGRLTVIGGMSRFRNGTIGSHDHAELLRRMLALQSSTRDLIVVHLARELPIWGWLRDHALPTMTATAVLLALWLARILPRFGPIRPEPPPSRRQLREHILATGRFRWTHGGRAGLLDAARAVCHDHIAARQPRLAQLPPARRWSELAALTGLDPAVVAGAFTRETHSARDLVQIVGTLASIHAIISRPREARSARHQPP